MRRWITVLLLLGIAAAAVWTLLDRPGRSAAADPWEAVPARAVAVIAVKDPLTTWDRWTHTSQYWSVLSTLDDAADLDRVLAHLAAPLDADGSLRDAIRSLTVITAIVPADSGHAPLFAWAWADRRPCERLVAALGGGALDERAGSMSWSVEAREGAPRLHLTWSSGLVLLSTDPAVIEEGLRARKERAPDTALQAARATLGEGADAHVMIQGAQLPRLLARWLKASAVDALALPQGWTALDLGVRSDMLVLSGVVQRDANSGWPSRLGAQASTLFALPRVLPAEVSAIRSVGITDPGAFLAQRDLSADEEANALLDWSNGALTLAFAPRDSGGATTWAVLRAEDPEAAWRSLERLCTDTARIDTARHRDQLMRRMCGAGAFERTFGSSFRALEHPWYTVLGDQVVFSDDLDALRRSVDSWIDGGSMAEDLATADLFQRASGEALASWWCDLSRAEPLVRAQCGHAASGNSGDRDAFLRSLGNVLVQVSNSPGGNTFLTITLQRRNSDTTAHPGDLAGASSPRAPASVAQVWRTTLPAPLARKPDVVRNHVNGTREVLALDSRNSLYLLSAAGQLLWSHPLDGPVLGPISQVDRFNNGKLQLLFNTAGRIYLIDRNGKDLPGFPVVLKDEATAPLAVFDYENKRDYRVLVPTAEGRVLNMDLSGRSIEGWSPPVLPKVSGFPVRHLRIRGKDHLLVLDNGGAVHVWDRQGAVREKVKLVLKDPVELVDVRAGLTIGGTTLTWIDSEGTVRSGSLDSPEGTVIRKNVEHQVMGGTNSDRITISCGADELAIDGRDGAVTRTFDGAIIGAPVLYDLGARSLIGAMAPDGAHLMDERGDDLPGSPYPSSVPLSIADLDLDGAFELVGANAKGDVTAYRIPR